MPKKGIAKASILVVLVGDIGIAGRGVLLLAPAEKFSAFLAVMPTKNGAGEGLYIVALLKLMGFGSAALLLLLALAGSTLIFLACARAFAATRPSRILQAHSLSRSLLRRFPSRIPHCSWRLSKT